MRNSEIEKKINKAISNSVPDVLGNILNSCEQKGGFEEEMSVIKKNEKKVKEPKERNVRTFPTKLVAVLAMAMICVCGVFGVNQYSTNLAVDSIVEFDVNPSIELKVNKKEKVIEAIPLNEDGKKIVSEMDLKDTDLNVAVNAIVGSMLKNGYISNDVNSILVSVKNDDAKKEKELQDRISKEIDAMLKASSVNGSILTQGYDDTDEIKKIAKENNISEGKAKLVSQILKSEVKDTKGNLITADALSKLSINELNLLLTSKQAKVDNVKTTGTASESSYIGREKAKEIALNHAQISATDVSRIEVELDYDDGKLVYEVDFRHGNKEYDYEIDAKTGDVFVFENEHDGSDGDSNYDDTDYGPNNDGITDYNDTDYGTNNDGVTDYNDTDYGPNNDGVTDYNDTDYGPNSDGDSSYSAPVTSTPAPTPSIPTTNNDSGYGDSSYGDSDSGYDSGDSDSGYDD